jgi:peptidyl-prolyl cis-trans isomerase C
VKAAACLAVLFLLLAACGEKEPASPPPGPRATDPVGGQRAEPDHISVDHILVGVRSPGFPQGKRDAEAARLFAEDLVRRLAEGADWAALKREHSEDPPPGGPYEMANHGATPRHGGEFRRDGMVPAFGDVGFTLAVGAVGLAPYHPEKSPFGFHVIKRVK